MFGILKSGLKLGIGCFIAGILFILLIIGAWYYFFGRKPATTPRNTNRRAAILKIDQRAATFAAPLKTANASGRARF